MKRAWRVISDTLYWASHIVGALLVLAVGKFIVSRRAGDGGEGGAAHG